MKKARILFLGMRFIRGDIFYLYTVIEKDNSLGREYQFVKKLFTKGAVGAINDCELEGSSIIYKRKDYPTYFIKGTNDRLFSTSIFFKKELDLAEVLNTQAETSKRNQTKGKSHLDSNIEEIRKTYRFLNGSQRSKFVADIIYKITR